MRYVVFDIETRGGFARGKLDVRELELTVVGAYDSATDAYTGYFKEDLPKLWPILEHADLLIGYNSDSFDIPLLNRYYPGDLSTLRSLDLMVEVQKVLGRRLRLDTLAQATLGKGKSGDGSKAIEWWDQGLHDKVREYCIQDVRLTRELYEYARKEGKLKYKDLRETKEIKLDTGAWDKPSEGPSMTHALQL